jgi:hypothetical protein
MTLPGASTRLTTGSDSGGGGSAPEVGGINPGAQTEARLDALAQMLGSSGQVTDAAVDPASKIGQLVATLLATGAITDASAASANALACSVTPRSFPGLAWSIDPSLLATGALATIADTSGRLATQLANGTVTIDRTGLPSGIGSIRCGAGHIYDAAHTPIGADNWSIHVVVYPTSVAALATILQFGVSTPFSLQNSGTGLWQILGHAAGVSTFGVASTAAPSVISVFRRAGVLSARVNGVAVAMSAPTLAIDAPDAFFCLGSLNGGATWSFTGSVGECALYSAGLSDAQANLLERAFARRGGFDLP